MSRGPLFDESYTPQFSGHETFPLRYGWLKKVHDRVAATQEQETNKLACWGDSAIARFGVGKNMVKSMRHWAKTAGVIDEPDRSETVRVTPLGDLIYGPRNVDPYMEHPETLWLVHWQITARPDRTTWFWAFSHFPAIAFERQQLVTKLERLAKDRQWARTSTSTIKNDVQCFLRTYVAPSIPTSRGHEDALESPLTELGLIKAVGRKDGFRFVRGSKPTLGNGVFVYALLRFWGRFFASASTLSFEAIAHAPGSPGRVFVFDEDDVMDRLAVLEEVTGGALRWSETAGLKQVVRNIDVESDEEAFRFLMLDFCKSGGGKAA